MYTVVRFIGIASTSRSELEKIGEKLNALVEGTFTRLDHVGGRFSIPICTDPTWNAHVAAIERFLVTMAPAISDAVFKGFDVVADVAVELEDGKGELYVYLEVPRNLLRALEAQNVSVGFTFYRAAT